MKGGDGDPQLLTIIDEDPQHQMGGGGDRVEQCIISSSSALLAWSTLSGLIKLVSFNSNQKECGKKIK